MTQELRLLITAEEIGRTVERLAGEINRDYSGDIPVLVGALKGAFVFLSDLARGLDVPHMIDFVQPASYGERGALPGAVVIERDLSMDVGGRHVILVEGIVDRGNTIRALREHITARGPASVRVCALLVRDGGSRELVDYAGKFIGDGFVVGYGMDYRERYRGLKAVYVLDAPEEYA